MALRLKSAVEDAGGSEVWVKGATLASFPSRRNDIPAEILAVPPTFDRVLSALKAEAVSQALQVRLESKRGSDGRRLAEVQISRQRQLIGRWRVREVDRLLRAAIVIDDLGQNFDVAEQLLALPYPLTFSVLPRLPHSVETADAAHRAGRAVMLHLPMEPDPGSHVTAGAGAIKVGMAPDAVVEAVKSDLAAVPYARGVNNHMGSRATADPALMKVVMQVLAEEQVYFIDSRTTASTSALDVARETGVPAFYRSVFLDDTEAKDYTLGQLRELCRVVRQRGVALAIGHPHATTVAALKEFLPEFERDDIQLVPASELVRLPEAARLSPPHPAGIARHGK
ncbi:MAG TPA: divergent polysaccharide deacetylase family protein [Terriglobia bacterium]|nr:divergent polysaccharide deacetylase family protein [Terriglobia bacterium]